MAEILVAHTEQSPVNIEKQRRYDLETRFAELVDGNMRNDFELRFEGNDLIGEDGRGMRQIAKDSLNDAKAAAKVNPKLWFEVRRRGFENDEIGEEIEMARGERPNTMVTFSDFPAELMDAKEDVGGYNVKRQQTMLRILTLKPDGNVQMYSQSLDGSNRLALEAVYARFGIKPEDGELLGQRINVDMDQSEQTTLIDELTGIYDRSLEAQFGGQWHAGRRPADYRNTYDFVCRQTDLIEECIRLDNLGWLNDETMYKMSAAMQKRFKNAGQGDQTSMVSEPAAVNTAALHREIEWAGALARKLGMSFSACGVTLKFEDFDGSTEDQMESAGYGNKTSEKDDYGPLTFKCQKGHNNTRPRDKLIEKCTTCGISVKC